MRVGYLVFPLKGEDDNVRLGVTISNEKRLGTREEVCVTTVPSSSRIIPFRFMLCKKEFIRFLEEIILSTYLLAEVVEYEQPRQGEPPPLADLYLLVSNHSSYQCSPLPILKPQG